MSSRHEFIGSVNEKCGCYFESHGNHVATGFFHRLLHNSRHFLGLALAQMVVLEVIMEIVVCTSPVVATGFPSCLLRL